MNDAQIQMPSGLLAEIRCQSSRKIPGGDLGPVIEKLREEYKDSLLAVVLYGSCLRNHNIHEGVVDLYVIVSDYKSAYSGRFERLINWLLPPNVFYSETGSGDSLIRTKYAVISLDDFNNAIDNWFHSYIWSRFAQPVRLLYTRDEIILDQLLHAFARSVLTFLRKTIPALRPGRYDTESIWINGLKLTYAAELRPEKHSRAEYITHQSMGDLSRLTQLAVPAITEMIQALPKGYYQVNMNRSGRKRCLLVWRIRRWEGRFLSVFRLMKAVYTFKDCVDYAAWKIKRHTGITIPVTQVLQRHPILFGFNILWRLLRRDALH